MIPRIARAAIVALVATSSAAFACPVCRASLAHADRGFAAAIDRSVLVLLGAVVAVAVALTVALARSGSHAATNDAARRRW